MRIERLNTPIYTHLYIKGDWNTQRGMILVSTKGCFNSNQVFFSFLFLFYPPRSYKFCIYILYVFPLNSFNSIQFERKTHKERKKESKNDIFFWIKKLNYLIIVATPWCSLTSHPAYTPEGKFLFLYFIRIERKRMS